MSRHLAAYGTLRTGQANDLSPSVAARMQSLGTGRIRGRIYAVRDPESGAALFPALVASDEPEDFVVVEVFQLGGDEAHTEEIAEILLALDACEQVSRSSEESPHARRLVPVFGPGGDEVLFDHAWAYFYNRPLGSADRIASGDWAAAPKSGKTGT